MKTNLRYILFAISLCLASNTYAALTPYANEAAFDAAAGALTVQTFASAGAGGILGCGNSLDSTTSGCGLAVGDIAAGLSFTATGNHPGNDLVGIAPGSFGNTNGGIFANFFVETLNLSFAPGVRAVGLGLLSEFVTSDFMISFFDESDILLSSFLVNNVPDTGIGKFFGVITTAGESIARINLSSNNDQAEGVDLVKFSASSVPEPSTLALLGLGLTGAVFSRRRSRG